MTGRPVGRDPRLVAAAACDRLYRRVVYELDVLTELAREIHETQRELVEAVEQEREVAQMQLQADAELMRRGPGAGA